MWLYVDREAFQMWTQSSPEEFDAWHAARVPATAAESMCAWYDEPEWVADSTRHLRWVSDTIRQYADEIGTPYGLWPDEALGFVRFNAVLTPDFGPQGFWGVLQGAGVATLRVDEPPRALSRWRWESVRLPVYRACATYELERWVRQSMDWRWTRPIGVGGHIRQVSDGSLEILPIMIRDYW
ncbi:MAG: hypothetical protein HGB10_03905 [Coriobacteriia bacterium]|nr:hypothetical protein [Coriobacteriia bacterium]